MPFEFAADRFGHLYVTGQAMKTVVIYRLGSLGDTVIALPFFNRITELYPEHRRVLLTNVPVSAIAPLAMSVLGNGKSVHEAIRYPVGTRDPRELLRLRAALRQYQAEDLIYMMPSRSLPAAARDYLFLRSCGFQRLIGWSLRRDLRLVRSEASGTQEPEIERMQRALVGLGPIDLQDRRLWDFRLDADEARAGHDVLAAFGGRPVVSVNMGGKLAIKDWGEANWTKLLVRLRTILTGWGILVVGAAEEAGLADRVTQGWPGPVVNACGRLAPRPTAAAFAETQLFIGHDSGPMHLANAVGVPCVALFGSSTHPRKWHPYLGENRVIHRVSGIADITVDEVVEAVIDLVAATGQRPAQQGGAPLLHPEA